MTKAWHPCPTPGCPSVVPPSMSRCPACQRTAEAKRGTARQRGYGGRHERVFRRAVLRKDPLCVCTAGCKHHGTHCLAPSAHADHWPIGRDELVRQGLNPLDPKHGRGLCARCHSVATAQHQPGGWAAR